MIIRFFVQFLLVNATLFLLVGGGLYLWSAPDISIAFITATALTMLNTLGGSLHAILKLRSDKETRIQDYQLAKVGNMLLRLLLLITAVALILRYTNLPEIAFTLGLFISYICNSVLEVIFILKTLANQRVNH